MQPNSPRYQSNRQQLPAANPNPTRGPDPNTPDPSLDPNQYPAPHQPQAHPQNTSHLNPDTSRPPKLDSVKSVPTHHQHHEPNQGTAVPPASNPRYEPPATHPPPPVQRVPGKDHLQPRPLLSEISERLVAEAYHMPLQPLNVGTQPDPNPRSHPPANLHSNVHTNPHSAPHLSRQLQPHSGDWSEPPAPQHPPAVHSLHQPQHPVQTQQAMQPQVGMLHPQAGMQHFSGQHTGHAANASHSDSRGPQYAQAQQSDIQPMAFGNQVPSGQPLMRSRELQALVRNAQQLVDGSMGLTVQHNRRQATQIRKQVCVIILQSFAWSTWCSLLGSTARIVSCKPRGSSFSSHCGEALFCSVRWQLCGLLGWHTHLMACHLTTNLSSIQVFVWTHRSLPDGMLHCCLLPVACPCQFFIGYCFGRSCCEALIFALQLVEFFFQCFLFDLLQMSFCLLLTSYLVASHYLL